jgi:hypothetical protein
MTNQEKFHKAICDIRKAWGLKTSTFEEICQLIGIAISLSANSDVNDEMAQVAMEAIWLEWTGYRAGYFMMKSPEEVYTNIVRWPQGKHYYVKIYGNGVSIEEKFNRVQDAEKFLKDEVVKLEQQGKKVIAK